MLPVAISVCVVSQVWLNHHWDDPALSNVRHRLCRNETANDECAVPIAGFPHGTADLWCEARYDSTDCVEIKEEVSFQIWRRTGVVRQGGSLAVGTWRLAVGAIGHETVHVMTATGLSRVHGALLSCLAPLVFSFRTASC